MSDNKIAAASLQDDTSTKTKGPYDDNEPCPPCLLGMSESEISKFGRRTTFKMDMIVMPALTILYVLNYLGEAIGR
jgi:hypothetical protein